MWMGGLWLRAQAIRYGFYMVSSTPDGCTFVDMDGTIIAESFTMFPQTLGQNNLIFEDLNFDRDIFHCYADGKLHAIRDRYGSRVHIRNRPHESIAVIETLDPDLSKSARGVAAQGPAIDPAPGSRTSELERGRKPTRALARLAALCAESRQKENRHEQDSLQPVDRLHEAVAGSHPR